LVLAVWRPGVGATQQSDQPADINRFFDGLVGEWIGTFAQANGKVQAPTKYFHAVVTVSGPASYKSVFEYYRIDEKTHKPVQAGISQMITSIDPDGTATNVIIGKGDVIINDEETPETHQFSETLRMTSLGVLQGLGKGSIKANGQNGKVSNYASTWTMHAGSFRIVQQIRVTFRVLFFSWGTNISTDFTGSRGSDIMGLISTSEEKANHAPPKSDH